MPQRDKNGLFLAGNKVAEKWTEKQALQIGEELIEWMQPDIEIVDDKEVDTHVTNIFFMEFLVYKGLYGTVLEYLTKKYDRFSHLLKAAKKIQEIKLIKWGTAGKLNPAVTIFVLKNHHGYLDSHQLMGDPDKPLIPIVFTPYELLNGNGKTGGGNGHLLPEPKQHGKDSSQ